LGKYFVNLDVKSTRRRGEAEAEAEARRGDGGSPRRLARRRHGGAAAPRRPRAAGISDAFIGSIIKVKLKFAWFCHLNNMALKQTKRCHI